MNYLIATLEIKNGSYCKDPYFSIILKEECEKATKDLGFNIEDIILDKESSNNQSGMMETLFVKKQYLEHCYEQDNQIRFGKKPAQSDSAFVNSLCNPGDLKP